ncbi:uncharacterized protein LOC121773897 [Salvia splendens]|uniref:uncharacterized protein LOC121773897 n=1 Tax=Salvia splendens TaxID=180675 RepID=UPI001C25C380|nr:uncharacterized protein LOC121773897 [Salvia splendens]
MGRPRGRPRSIKRLTRMDAAVDAMLPLGFSEAMVKKRVKKLLKEYGGDEGWPFIEESAYSVLIESILENMNDDEQTQLEEKDAQNELSEPVGNQEANQLPDKTCGDEEPVCSRAFDTQEDVPSDIVEHPSEAVAEVTPLPSSSTPRDSNSLLLLAMKRKIILDDDELIVLKPAASTAMGERATLNPVINQEAIQLPDKPRGNEEPGCSRASDTPENVVPSDIMEPPTEAVAEATPLPALSPPQDITPLPQSAIKRRRFPCYGWIDSDGDDEDDEFIILTPAVSTAKGERATPNPVGNQEAIQLSDKPHGDKKPGCSRASDTKKDTVPSDTSTEAVAEVTPLSAPSPPGVTTPQLPQPAIRRRRLPCYGWIGSDEDDDNEFINLTPAASKATEERATLDGIAWTKKRRSRWDV